jgi:hypothetical protein
VLITSVEKGVNILAAARIRAASGALWPPGNGGSPNRNSAAGRARGWSKTRWQTSTARLFRRPSDGAGPVDSSHSAGSSAPLLWACRTDGSSRGVWGRRTRGRDFLHGGPQRPLAGGRWIGRRRGGGLYRRRAMAVRRRACSATAIQGFLAAASLPGVASLAGVASQPGVEGRHAARCTRRSAAASVASISAGFAGGELGAWVSLSDGRPRICVRSVR